MLPDETLSDLHDLALAIAPELKAAPLYILNETPALPFPANTRGIAITGACFPVREHLDPLGRWKGWGPSIILSDTLTESQAPATVIHEVAHLLPHRPIVEIPSGANESQLQRESIAAWAINPEPPSTCKPRWQLGGHDKDFHRVLIHLWWRAALLGRMTFPNDLASGLDNDLSNFGCYWLALGSAEPTAMKDKTFDEILATDPPAEFSALWRADLSHWLSQHPNALEGLKND